MPKPRKYVPTSEQVETGRWRETRQFEVEVDDPLRWSDLHFRECFDWLKKSPMSPYQNAPFALLQALGCDTLKSRRYMNSMLCNRNGPMQLQYRTRFRLTARFKRVLAGKFTFTFRFKREGYKVFTDPDPKPIPYPNWLRGSIDLTGPAALRMGKSEIKLLPRHDPESLQRLMNPWGTR